MAPDLARITAALNAYPWTAGALTYRDGPVARYCAVGLLLRYAGVPQAEIACALSTVDNWARHRALLEAEYGITEPGTVVSIMEASDSAATHEEAIRRVQRVLSTGPSSRARLLGQTYGATPGRAVPPTPAPRDDHEGGGAFATLG